MYRYWMIVLMFGLIGCGGGGSSGVVEVALQTPTNEDNRTQTPTDESNQTLKDENTKTDSNTFVPQESNTTLQDAFINGLGAIPASPQALSYIPIVPTPTGDFGVKLPRLIDLSPQMPPVRHQGSQNSCVGWAVGYYLKSFQEHIETNSSYGQDGNYSGVFSPSFVYNITKLNTSCESGSSLVAALEIARDIGVSSWDTMPYNQNSCNTIPSQQSFKNAKCNTIASYERFDLSYPISHTTIINMKVG